MPFPGLSPDDMRKALTELDQALFNHEQWCEELNRTLICRLPPDRRDIDDQAHKNCRFGQWLYRDGAKHLSQHAAFKEIEAFHMRMHRAAAEMLEGSTRGQEVPLDRYERFINAMKQMRLEVLTTKRELEDALYNLDPLSGAANRIGMLTKLREQQSLVARKLQSCAVAMMDFDHFKRINDTYGHSAGDQVIVRVAQLVRQNLRPFDTLFRYGGEEFLICTPHVDLDAACKLLERLRREIAAMTFDDGHGRSFAITVSLGVALLDPAVSTEESIERADKALYAAKSAGRNRVMVWDSSMA